MFFGTVSIYIVGKGLDGWLDCSIVGLRVVGCGLVVNG